MSAVDHNKIFFAKDNYNISVLFFSSVEKLYAPNI